MMLRGLVGLMRLVWFRVVNVAIFEVNFLDLLKIDCISASFKVEPQDKLITSSARG